METFGIWKFRNCILRTRYEKHIEESKKAKKAKKGETVIVRMKTQGELATITR